MIEYKIEVFTIKSSFSMLYKTENTYENSYLEVLQSIYTSLNEGLVKIESFKSEGRPPETIVIPREKIEYISVKVLSLPEAK